MRIVKGVTTNKARRRRKRFDNVQEDKKKDIEKEVRNKMTVLRLERNGRIYTCFLSQCEKEKCSFYPFQCDDEKLETNPKEND